MPADGGDLWRRASGLGQPTTRSLAQSMWRESLEADARAPLGEPLAELLAVKLPPRLLSKNVTCSLGAAALMASASSAVIGIASGVLVFCAVT